MPRQPWLPPVDGRRVLCRILPAGGSTPRREQRLQLSPLGMRSEEQGGVLADSCFGGREIRMVWGEGGVRAL